MTFQETQAIVRELLDMDRDPSVGEIEELQASLQRKAQRGTLDDRSEMLMLRLAVMELEPARRNRER